MKQKIIIFGASILGRAAFDIVNHLELFEVYAFADNSKEKQKGIYLGLKVLSADEAIRSSMPILLASIYKDEIKEQLENAGCYNYMYSLKELHLDLTNEQIENLKELTSYAYKTCVHEILYDFYVEPCKNNLPVENDKVVFSCNTIYQFLTCALLKRIYFNDKKCVLLAGGMVAYLKDLLVKIDPSLFCKTVGFEYRHNMSFDQLKEITDAYGTPELSVFFKFSALKVISNFSSNTKFIFADEGLSFYELDALQKKDKAFDKYRVDEFWGYNKNLFVSPKESIPFKEINFPLDELKRHLPELNKLFNYTHTPINSDIIYFDAPLYQLTNYENEKKVEEMLVKVFQGYDVMIKLHPASFSDKYRDTGLKIFPYGNIPWELYRLNEMVENKPRKQTYVSIFSAASLFDYLFGQRYDNKPEINIIFIYKLLQSIITDANALNLNTFDFVRERFKDPNIFIPEDINEFSDILTNCLRSK